MRPLGWGGGIHRARLGPRTRNSKRGLQLDDWWYERGPWEFKGVEKGEKDLFTTAWSAFSLSLGRGAHARGIAAIS